MVAKWMLALAITAALGLALVAAEEKTAAPVEKPAVKAEEKTVKAEEKSATKSDAKTALKAGDQIILRISGKVAVEMCQRMGFIKPNDADPMECELGMLGMVAEVVQ